MDNELLRRFPNLQELLEKRIAPCSQAKLVNFQCATLGPSEAGMVSLIYRATLQWQPSLDDLPTLLIIKIPRMGHRSSIAQQLNDQSACGNAVCDFLDLSHNTEVAWYSLFNEHAEKAPVPLPTCYVMDKMNGDKESGILAMEDIRARGALLVEDMSVSMSAAQLFNIVSALANLHAWSWTTTLDWKAAFQAGDDKEKTAVQLNKSIQLGIGWLKENYPHKTGHVDSNVILDYFTSTPKVQLRQKWAQIMPSVIVHGDLWTNNIFFKATKDGEVGDEIAAIIDWQMVESGTVFEDLCYVLTWCTSASVRREHSRALVSHYRKCLVDNLQGRMVVADEETLWSAFEETLPVRAFLLTSLLNILMGTTVKRRTPESEEEMTNRAVACYEDASALLEKKYRL